MMDKYAWQAAAYYSAKRIIARKYRTNVFLAETLLVDVIKDIGETYDYRCWGGVIGALSADKLIFNYGYAAAKTSNGSAKKVWSKKSGWSKK